MKFIKCPVFSLSNYRYYTTTFIKQNLEKKIMTKDTSVRIPVEPLNDSMLSAVYKAAGRRSAVRRRRRGRRGRRGGRRCRGRGRASSQGVWGPRTVSLPRGSAQAPVTPRVLPARLSKVYLLHGPTRSSESVGVSSPSVTLRLESSKIVPPALMSVWRCVVVGELEKCLRVVRIWTSSQGVLWRMKSVI